MNLITATKNGKEEVLFLTQILGAQAYFNGKKMGKLEDLVAVDQDKLAEVTHFQIARPFGEPPLLVPVAKVLAFGSHGFILDVDELKSYARTLALNEVLLREYLLDKKVLDLEDREVEVVYDIRLVRTNGNLYVSDVDISRYGLLRRLGFKALADHFYKRADEAKKKLIPWSYIQPLPPQLGALEGNVKLNILKEELADIHPADLADIVEELDSAQRVTVLEGLDTERASDTLEEVDPAVQRDIVFSLRKERVAQLIGEMTSGQAADIVSVLPADEKKTILGLLEPATVAKIEEILRKHEINILNFTTIKFMKCPPDMTVKQARRKFREAARSMDVVMYFYVVDTNEKLLGVIDIKQLFMAEDDELLKNLMVEHVISLNPESTMKQAADAFIRYGFRALPVTDVKDIILGVVPYRDVMNLKHRMLD
ncbi:MAG TPA: CBS domain-containing protein [Terriglobales bacterium]|nr:CBS domain-containing protein [Terriglobales bacterium]